MFLEEVPGLADEVNVATKALSVQVCSGRKDRHPHELRRMWRQSTCTHASALRSCVACGDNRTLHAEVTQPPNRNIRMGKGG